MGAWWLLFGGSAASVLVVFDRPVSELKKAVKRVIPAGDRREVILFDLHLWESGQEEQDEAVRADRKKLVETLRRKATQPSEVEPIVGRLDATFLEMDRNFLDLRFQVKDKVTSAEWTGLVARGDR
jgi:hypothetical protein